MTLPIEQTQRKPLTLEERAANPLTLVTRDLRKPLGWFWMCYSHLLPSALPIAALLATWQKRDIVRTDEVIAVFQEMTLPGSAANYRFASDLMTDLSSRIGRIVEKRRAAEKLRAEQKEQSSDAIDRSQWPEFLASLTKGIL